MSTLQEYEQLADAVTATWRNLLAGTPPAVRAGVARAAQENAERVGTRFYEHMLAHASSAPYLNLELVSSRLRREMSRWLTGLFTNTEAADIDAQIAQQVAVGAVHARIRLPVELMSVGAHVLGRELTGTLVSYFADDRERCVATHYALDLVALATGMILSAFVRETRRGARNEEAFRQAAFRQDTALERERQRAALSEWAQRCFSALAHPRRQRLLAPLGRSDFGRWLAHKGALLFDGVGEWEDVLGTVRHVDAALLPRLAAGTLAADTREALTEELESRVDAIRQALNTLFERARLGDGARDPVTRLIERRYIDAVLAHEVGVH
ncbi:MAG: protoglobin domain-containing protein, partial [Gammaproteobacteria bacterium]